MPVLAWRSPSAAVSLCTQLTWYVSMLASTGIFQLTGTSRSRWVSRWRLPSIASISLRSVATGPR